VIALEVADLVLIAGRTLGLDTARVLDLLDPAAAEQALAQARRGGEPGDPADRAAALLHALVRRRPLRRGNQEVALAAMLQFLALNGWDVDPDPPGPMAVMVANIAAGTLNTTTIADLWLAPRLLPRDPAEAQVRETSMRTSPVRLTMRLKKATMQEQPTGMFRRFTDAARRVCYLAQEEARLLRHDYVGTEHLLLALLYEREGGAAQVLESLGISRADVLGQIGEITGAGQGSRVGPIPFIPPGKKAMELALREALALGRHYIGTEHLLLGLLREDEGVAARVLTRLGTDHALVRERVLGLLADECEQADPQVLATDLADTAERLSQVRQDKEAEFSSGHLEAAAALRDQERQLLADRLRLENELTADRQSRAIIAENQRLHRELDRLRDLLRRHGIGPDGGTARTA
jgi:prophage maintenance system killer protein